MISLNQPFLFLLIIMVSAMSTPVSADCQPCGPDFCKDDPRYPPLLEQKKQNLRSGGYPDYLVELLDKDGACVARVERAPDSFSIQRVKHDGSWEKRIWTTQGEDKAKDDLEAGSLSSYNMFNVSRAFKCCGDSEYHHRPDYDPALDLNKDLAIIRQ